MRRFPRHPCPQGRRRRDDLHARPLARADGRGRLRGRQGRLARKAHHPHHRRGTPAQRHGRQAGAHLPRRQRAALQQDRTPGGHAGAQRADRPGPHGQRGRAGKRRRLPAPAGNARPQGARLRALAGAGPPGVLHREARPQAQVVRPPGLDAPPLLLRRHDHQLDDALERRGHVGDRPGADRAGRDRGDRHLPAAGELLERAHEVRRQDAFCGRREVDLPDRVPLPENRRDRRLGPRRLPPAQGRAGLDPRLEAGAR